MPKAKDKKIVGLVMTQAEAEELRRRAQEEGRSVSNLGMMIIKGKARPIC